MGRCYTSPFFHSIRMFLIFPGTLLNQSFFILVSLALLTNLKIFTRIYSYYKKANKYGDYF